MLTINHLEVTYGNYTALTIDNPITFYPGDRIGIIGSNGAGKTTLIKAILGIVDYEGSIHSELSPEQIAVHMQFNHYADTMHVKHIMETILNTSIKKNKELQELITFFEFHKCLNKKYSQLSGGQQQRMTIILILMQKAELVFFDEVTSGLDFETRQKLMELLTSWYKDHASTVCMVSHYYDELEQMVNKLLILDNGHIVDFGSKEDLFRKYCGNVIISMENSNKNQEVTKELAKLAAPKHELVISCQNKEEETKLVTTLITKNINFKRSTNDLEILYINAKENYQKQLSENINKRTGA